MIRPTLLRAIPLALGLLIGTTAAVHADEVVLKDGSRLLGTVKTLEDGTLTISGGAAGTVTIPFSSVRSISTDRDQTIVLADGTEVRARFATTETGDVQIVRGTGREPVRLARIQAIDPAAEPPAVTHEGNVTASGKVTDGNTRQKKISTFAEYIRRAKDNRTTVRADWNYAEDSSALSERNASLRGKYDHFFTEKLFGYANASLKRDDFADLRLRTTVGGGAGYQFVEDDTYKFYEEIGVSYFNEDFDVAPNEDTAVLRFSGKFDWVITPDKVTFFHFHEGFQGLEESDDLLIDTQTGVRLTIVENFYASFQINYKWDNTPPSGTNRSDTEYLVGLGYSYTF